MVFVFVILVILFVHLFDLCSLAGFILDNSVFCPFQLQCQVRSFYDGHSHFSQYMQSTPLSINKI